MPALGHEKPQRDVVDVQVAIVGAGPIGLELAVVLKHMGVDAVHFDAGQVAQTISWYPRQARFFSSPERIAIAGVPLTTADQSKATREAYLAYLRGIVQQFDLKVNTYERVTAVQRDEAGFTLRTDRRGEPRAYRARHVVLAVGDMHKPRRLNVPGEDMDHVSHYFDEPHRYFNQRLLIVGGRNSAVEAALRCHHAGARVSLAYRRGRFDEKAIKYWLLPELKSLIKHGKIAFHPNTCVERIAADEVALRDSQDASASPQTVAADFVLLLTGYEMDTTLFELAGVELVGENRSPRFDTATMQTNVPGLYVAGTAAAGTQVRFKLFIENCHAHASKIAASITGRQPPMHLVNQAAKQFGLPES
ncbi:MAG: NAD(P)-binding domain-containing protein [Phycisphaeraceae bacterium]